MIPGILSERTTTLRRDASGTPISTETDKENRTAWEALSLNKVLRGFASRRGLPLPLENYDVRKHNSNALPLRLAG
jgi:hypothetical protein